ncbi:MAG: hypothetical protein Q4F63_00255 [Clostridia bacterium]|nr:hypothetical protein [Clostridia bacterium]
MNALQKYFNYRQSLIDQYVKGDLTKKEYLDKNFDAVLSIKNEPFKRIDSVEKGLFNYQFFNAMAKDAFMEAKRFSHKDFCYIYTEQVDYYYGRKDNATMKILELLDFREIEAYFIKVKSRELKNKLFEIILKDTGVILHSTSETILVRLKEENCFSEGIRKSVIDGYINNKY